MNDFEEIISALLNVNSSDIDKVDTVNSSQVKLYVSLKRREIICDKCKKPMVLNGTFKRALVVPNKAFENAEVFIKAKRYRCFKCGYSVSDIGHMSPTNKKTSYASIIEIMDLLSDPHMTFKGVSNITGISETSVIRIFDKHCHIPRVPLPEILCIDEVYTKNSDFKSKYSCIFYDFKKHNVVEVLPSRRKDYLHMYLTGIPIEERNNVKYVCIDMYMPYKEIIQIYFKKAIICVDSFHVVKHLNDDLNRLRIRHMKSYEPDSQEYYLLNKFRFLLLDRTINLDNKSKYNKKFERYLNYRDLLELILSINSEIRYAYELKEEYIKVNSTFTYEEIKENIDVLIDDFIEADIKEYEEFVILLKNWKNEIVNSFIQIDGKRINNGIAESINETVSLITYITKGIRNTERRRKRIMYSINKNGFNLR